MAIQPIRASEAQRYWQSARYRCFSQCPSGHNTTGIFPFIFAGLYNDAQVYTPGNTSNAIFSTVYPSILRTGVVMGFDAGAGGMGDNCNASYMHARSAVLRFSQLAASLYKVDRYSN